MNPPRPMPSRSSAFAETCIRMCNTFNFLSLPIDDGNSCRLMQLVRFNSTRFDTFPNSTGKYFNRMQSFKMSFSSLVRFPIVFGKVVRFSQPESIICSKCFNWPRDSGSVLMNEQFSISNVPSLGKLWSIFCGSSSRPLQFFRTNLWRFGNCKTNVGSR